MRRAGQGAAGHDNNPVVGAQAKPTTAADAPKTTKGQQKLFE